MTAKVCVLGFIYNAHPSLTELRRYLIMRNGLSKHQCSSETLGSFASASGYKRSNSGSPWRIVRSGSCRVQTGFRYPASHAFFSATMASFGLSIEHKVQAML